MSFCDLHSRAASRWDHINVVPPVLVGEERDPTAIGGGLRLGSGLPIGQTPEFVFVVLVYRFDPDILHIRYIDSASLELVRLASEDNTSRIDPRGGIVIAFCSDWHHAAASRWHGEQLTGDILRIPVHELLT